MNFKRIISMPVCIDNPPDISDYLDTITPKNESFVDDPYRVSPSIVLMTPNGQWLDHDIPEFKDWAENYLFPALGQKSQLVVITTPPNRKMAPHIDCSPEKFNTIQHKFRYVMRGNVGDLRWLHKDGETYTPEYDTPYIISGKWPHDMHNTHDQIKYTLCFGAPWEPTLSDPKYVSLLEKSHSQYSKDVLTFDQWQLPENWRELFNQERYGIPHDLEPTFINN